jgi:DNA mismatch endonuclease, patch repair protein
MVDHVDALTRSAIMASVKSADTGPEMTLRRLLHALGYRYRLHHAHLPGRPDLAFPARRKVIFVHGCFWHRHEGCRYAGLPKTRPEFWQAKFDSNEARDKRNRKELQRLGWKSMVVWQCELQAPEKVLRRVIRFLETG